MFKKIMTATAALLVASQSFAADVALENATSPEFNRVVQEYSRLMKNIEKSANANEFDGHYHELGEFFAHPGETPLANLALCEHLKTRTNYELQYLEGLIELNARSLSSCHPQLIGRIFVSSWSDDYEKLEDRIAQLKPIPFEERTVPAAGYLRMDGFNKKEVMLTFDDGPTFAATMPILAALNKVGAKAAFFSLGENALKNPTLAREILAQGHVLGSHSYHHTLAMGTKMTKGELSNEFFLSEFIGGHLGVYLAANYVDPYFRFPNGDMTPGMAKNVNQLGLKVFGWSVDSWDWGFFPSKYPDVKVRNQNVLKKVIEGLNMNKKGIILMHDLSRHSAEALVTVLEYLSANNYKIVLLKPENRNMYAKSLPLITPLEQFMNERRVTPEEIYPRVKESPRNYRSRIDFTRIFPQLTFD